MTRLRILAIVLVSAVTFVASASAGVLPNGWTVTPAGALTTLGTLPLHMALDPSGKWIAVTNSGYATEGVAVVNAQTGAIASQATLDGTFYGIAFSPDGRTLYASTAAGSGVARFAFDPATGALTKLGAWKLDTKNIWVAGIAVSPDGKTVYAAANYANALYAIDATTGAIRWKSSTGDQPYAVVLSPDGSQAYVSDWIGGDVDVFSTSDGSGLAAGATIDGLPGVAGGDRTKIARSMLVDAHPNAMALSPDGATLYVACANAGTVDAVDTHTFQVRSSIDTGIRSAGLTEGTTPDGVALSPDGGTLYVADADDDAVVAVDLRDPTPHVIGAIPVGWYATDVALSRDGKSLYALDGKGISGHANPLYQHGDTTAKEDDTWYDAEIATGDLERVVVPDASGLAGGLRMAIADSPYTDVPFHQPAPSQFGSVAGVRHVIYVIKENRTYDEILGDDPRGNGMASLAIFGKRITPNIHRIADDFVLLDDFDVDSTVSADGHNWADAAYASDYTQKLWPSNYSGRGRGYEFEGSKEADPLAGYLWDDANVHHVSFRDYGEYVSPVGHAESKGLVGEFDPKFVGWDLKYSDQRRMDEWTREFESFVKNGGLPALEMVYLPDDHTGGVSPGYRTPFAMLASNDYAVGRLVDTLSHSPYWKDTVVFVVEDDAQAGPDHVSDQRAEALIAGGPVKRGLVSHEHFTQCSMLRTIEMMLGMTPMSQFDAGATPMNDLLLAAPDLQPWTATVPDLDIRAMNPAPSSGTKSSMRLDFSEPDAVDASVMNAILLKYARANNTTL
jgi:YVTN family beta-propeller protein